MEQWQIGYLAGMIDAECHVGIQREFAKGRVTPQYTVRFELSMTDKGPVEFVNSLLPTAKIVRQNGRGRRLPVYRLRVIHSEAIRLLESALPYLQGKRRQVELCLELHRLRAEFSPSRRHLGSSHFQRMPQEFITKADALFAEFRTLQQNKKPRKFIKPRMI